MNMMAADSTTLYGLLARHWAVGTGVEGLEFDRAQDVVAFRLGDGHLALARMMDAEPPNDRYRMALDNGRATISPRSKPVPPVIQIALDEAPLHLAAFGEGTFLAGGRGGHLVRVLGSGVVEPFADIDSPITAIASIPGSGALAAAGATLLACDAGGAVRPLASIDTPVSMLSITPDSRHVAIGQAGGLLTRSLDPEGSSRHFAIGNVSGLSWSPDGEWLAASIEDGGIVLLRLADGRTFPIPDYPSPVRTLAWSADSRHLATSGAFRIITWKLDRLAKGVDLGVDLPENLETGRAGLMPVEAVDIHPSRPLVAAGYGNGMVVVAQIGKRDELVVKAAGDSAIHALRWSRDGQHLALGTEGGQAAIVTFPSHLFK